MLASVLICPHPIVLRASTFPISFPFISVRNAVEPVGLVHTSDGIGSARSVAIQYKSKSGIGSGVGSSTESSESEGSEEFLFLPLPLPSLPIK